MTYPSTNLNEAVGLIVPDSNALHDIINGDAASTVITPEGREVPTVLKAMTDSLLFKDPIPWEEGGLEQDPLQLRTFTDGLIYWAPTAQLTNPIAMGVSPIGDSNWKISPIIKSHNSLTNRDEQGAHPASAIDGIERGLEQSLGVNARIWPKYRDLQVGDVIPSAQETTDGLPITHVIVGGNAYSMNPLVNGVVSSLTPTEANIGGISVLLRNEREIVIQDLSNLPSLSGVVREGQVVGWMGYHTPLDGGSNKGIVRKGAHTPDGGSILTIDSDTYIEADMGDSIDCRKFGAIGDWNMETQTGNDDTQAIQSAINYRASKGSRRKGGVGEVYLPSGNYAYTKLELPVEIDFGFVLRGDSAGGTVLWADETVSGESINGLSEFTKFENITFIGALSDQYGDDSTKWRDLLFKGKLGWNYADIDVKFTNCDFLYFKKLSEIYGRGCVFDNCSFGFIQVITDIVCSPDTIFDNSSYFNSISTGMRHYVLRDCRTDVVSIVFDITGDGPQKDYINGLLVDGCEFAQTDILIRAVDGIVRGSTITDSNAVYSFATGPVQCKSINGLNIGNVNFAKHFDANTAPSGLSECINSLVKTTEYINDLTITGCSASYIAGNIVQAGSASKNIIITGNTFDSAWDIPFGANHFVFYSPHYCEGLSVSGNGFSVSNINGNYYLFDPSTQIGPMTKTGGNLASFRWEDARVRYEPKLLVGGVESSGTYSTFGRFVFVDDNFVEVWFMLVGNIPEASGALSISLPPVVAIAESVVLTGNYAGSGELGTVTGFSVPSASILPLKINPSTQECELYKSVGLSPSRLDASDKAGVVALFGRFKYRR